MPEKKRYRRKPIVVSAFVTDKAVDVPTLEGPVHAEPGYYILSGINNESWPVRADIFEREYVEVDDDHLT